MFASEHGPRGHTTMLEIWNDLYNRWEPAHEFHLSGPFVVRLSRGRSVSRDEAIRLGADPGRAG